jgi:hypothetical protein
VSERVAPPESSLPRGEIRGKFGHQPDSVFLHGPRRFVTILVILESVFDRQPGHANV